MAKKVMVAMSGGVDSSVAMLKIIEMGYDAFGVTMKLWDYQSAGGNISRDNSCCSVEEINGAKLVCDRLGVPHYTIDFMDTFKESVIDDFAREYFSGRTPNPCVRCNSFVKWDAFLKQAELLGADLIATGHYAQVKEDKNGWHLLRGKDPNKDQSYFLAGLNQKQLSKAVFPIGDIKKPEVRQIAKQAKLVNADRKDSQGICFIGKVDLKIFLQQKIKPKVGDIVDTKGNVLGEHQGVWYYTIGQRKGLDIGGSGPWYVVSKDIKNNKLIVGHVDDEALYNKSVQMTDLHWLGKEHKLPLKAKAQIRYRQPGQDIVLSSRAKSRDLIAEFKKSQAGVASGQILAVYKKDELIASGNIV